MGEKLLKYSYSIIQKFHFCYSLEEDAKHRNNFIRKYIIHSITYNSEKSATI